MTEHERKLFESARKGNVEAFEMLAEPYYKKVYNIILEICGSETDVSELAQEVFVRAFKSLRLEAGDVSLAAAIYKSAGEVCMPAGRRLRLIS